MPTYLPTFLPIDLGWGDGCFAFRVGECGWGVGLWVVAAMPMSEQSQVELPSDASCPGGKCRPGPGRSSGSEVGGAGGGDGAAASLPAPRLLLGGVWNPMVAWLVVGLYFLLLFPLLPRGPLTPS